MSYTAQVKNGKIVVDNLDIFYQNIKKLEGSKVTISIDKKTDKPRKKALLEMYYHRVVVPMILEGMVAKGWKVDIEGVKNDPTRDDVHDILKTKFNYRILHYRSGVTGDFGASTKKLTIPEMEEYLEKIRKWAKTALGVELPKIEQEQVIQYGKED